MESYIPAIEFIVIIIIILDFDIQLFIGVKLVVVFVKLCFWHTISEIR